MRTTKMWSRFGIFVLCFVAAVNSAPQADKHFRQVGNLESEFSTPGGGTVFNDQNRSGKAERQRFADTTERFGSNRKEEFNSHRPNFDGELFIRSEKESKEINLKGENSGLTKRPSEFISTSGNRKSNQNLNGSVKNNQKVQSSSTEVSEFSKIHEGDKKQGFGSTQSNPEGSSFSRPTEFSETIPSNGRLDNTERKVFDSSEKESINPSNIKKYDDCSFVAAKESNRNQKTGGQECLNNSSIKPGEINQTYSSDENKNKNGTSEKEDEEICFDYLGCFNMGKSWKSILRPIHPPSHPDNIKTVVYFYSRANLKNPQKITVYPEINLGGAQFDPSKITVLIVHGFSSSGNATWMRDMKDVYLKNIDAHVMIADWGNGAQNSNYLQVAGNTRVVGKELALFVKFLIEKLGADPGKFHLIGHSLGAQICSFIGKEVQGIGRLTALDPAQPGFEGFDRETRLDQTDAEFVDVIHTDARPFLPTLGFGMIAPHGHVDFYMNGGFDQPGCLTPPASKLPSVKSFSDLAKYPVEVISNAVSCPHGRAYDYLIESFNETDKCTFWGHKADIKNVIKSASNTITQGFLKQFTALSSPCSRENCVPLGFETKNSPLRGVFVVTTNRKSPYCISEAGIQSEMQSENPLNQRKKNSFIQKLGKHTGLSG